jgi:hypothetical protein
LIYPSAGSPGTIQRDIVMTLSGVYNVDVNNFALTIASLIRGIVAGGTAKMYWAMTNNEPAGATFWSVTNGTSHLNYTSFNTLTGFDGVKPFLNIEFAGAGAGTCKLTFTHTEETP